MAHAISSSSIYTEAFSIPYKWDLFLPKTIFDYHKLLYQEFNAPVELQMGTLLPFIAALSGPRVRGHWSTRESVINFYTINVAASGVGKTACRTRLVSEPLEYVMQNINKRNFPDMEVNKFTRAGIEDKLIKTGGYCMVVTDEGTGFFKDLKNKDSKNESDVALLNQLYDGKGDKMTLAKDVQRVIPKNATSMCISLQQEAYVAGINALGHQLWCDTGFGERFMVTACKPFRHQPHENKAAYLELKEVYGLDLIGKIALEIFNHHQEQDITYVLSEEAIEAYEQVVQRYNKQFNMKWNNSQEDSDASKDSEIPVRTKATELIGRLSIILWIYINAFECVHLRKDFRIPTVVSAECVMNADKIIRTSYSHLETFSSAVFSGNLNVGPSLAKPKKTDSNKILAAVVRSPGCVALIRLLNKSCKEFNVEYVKEELKSLEEEGFGKLMTAEEMLEGKEFKKFSVFFKPAPFHLDPKFLKRLHDKDLNDNFYLAQFRKATDPKLIHLVRRYHPHLSDLTESQCGSSQASNMVSMMPSMEQLDGNLKTSLFASSKSKKGNAKSSQDANVSDVSTTKKCSQSRNTKSGKKDTTPRKFQFKRPPNVGKDITEQDEGKKEDENITDESDDAFEAPKSTSSGKKSKQTITPVKDQQRPSSPDMFSSEDDNQLSQKNETNIVKRKETTSTKKIVKNITEEEVSVMPIKTMTSQDVIGGLTKRDVEDMFKDSSFENDFNSTGAPIAIKRKVVNVSNNEEEKENTVTTRERKIRGATKKYATRNYASDTDNSSKSDVTRSGKKKADVSMIIPESTSDKSDAATAQVAKRRRRLSRKHRNEQRERRGSQN